MFLPEVLRCDAEALDIKFGDCPLRNAWLKAGIADEDAAALCRIAAVVDNGQFKAAGFQFASDTWQPGAERCCFLHIRPGKDVDR
jgi:hypothetical protein